jgi:hypothetical protein
VPIVNPALFVPVPVVNPAPSTAVGLAPTWGLRILCDELEAEILAKSGDECENWLQDLWQMNNYWLERENNMACNCKLLRDMDLNQVWG